MIKNWSLVLIFCMCNAFFGKTQNIENDGLIADYLGGITIGNIPNGIFTTKSLRFGYDSESFIKGYYIDRNNAKHEGYFNFRVNGLHEKVLRFKPTLEDKKIQLGAHQINIARFGSDSLIRYSFMYGDEKRHKIITYITENENFVFFENFHQYSSYFAVNKTTNKILALNDFSSKINEKNTSEFQQIFGTEEQFAIKFIDKDYWSNAPKILEYINKVKTYNARKYTYFDKYWNVKNDSAGYAFKMCYGNFKENSIDALHYNRNDELLHIITYTGFYLLDKSAIICYDKSKILTTYYLGANSDSTVCYGETGVKIANHKNSIFTYFYDENGTNLTPKSKIGLKSQATFNNTSYHFTFDYKRIKYMYHFDKNGKKVYGYHYNFSIIPFKSGFQKRLRNELFHYSDEELQDGISFFVNVKILLDAKGKIIRYEILNEFPENYKAKIDETVSFFNQILKINLPDETDQYEFLLPIFFDKKTKLSDRNYNNYWNYWYPHQFQLNMQMQQQMMINNFQHSIPTMHYSAPRGF